MVDRIWCVRKRRPLDGVRLIRRFQQALQQVESRQEVQWTDLACACGYYDQAHFVHDFRGFSGLNPSAYLTQRGEYLNFVPMPEW